MTDPDINSCFIEMENLRSQNIYSMNISLLNSYNFGQQGHKINKILSILSELFEILNQKIDKLESRIDKLTCKIDFD